MKYLALFVCAFVALNANAGACNKDNNLAAYQAKGMTNGILFYGFRKDKVDYRFALALEKGIEFADNFREDRRAMIDGNFYQFIEQDISRLKFPDNLTESELLERYKKTIIEDIIQDGEEVESSPICQIPPGFSNHNFLSWKLDIKSKGGRPNVTQMYSSTVLGDQIITLNTGAPYRSNTINIEKSMLYYIKTFKVITSIADCPKS